MKPRSMFALALAVAGVALVSVSLHAQAPAPKPAAPAATQPAPPAPKWVEPVKGQALLQVLKPQPKVQGKDVVTILKVKNVSPAPVAGLRVDEYWYDKSGTVIGGDSKRMKQLVKSGEIVIFEMHTARDPKMNSNSYQFSHANGTVKVETVKKLD